MDDAASDQASDATPEGGPPPPAPVRPLPAPHTPAIDWLILVAVLSAAWWLLISIAPAENGDWGTSEADWLPTIAGSVFFTAAGLRLAERRRSSSRAAGDEPTRDSSRTPNGLLVAASSGLVVLAAVQVAVLVGHESLVHTFDEPVPFDRWLLAFGIAIGAGILVARAVPLPTDRPEVAPNNKARASFAIGTLSLVTLVGLCFVLSVAAIVIGHLALREIRASDGQAGGRDFALIGVVTGYAGVALGLGLWAPLFLPG